MYATCIYVTDCQDRQPPPTPLPRDGTPKPAMFEPHPTLMYGTGATILIFLSTVHVHYFYLIICYIIHVIECSQNESGKALRNITILICSSVTHCARTFSLVLYTRRSNVRDISGDPSLASAGAWPSSSPSPSPSEVRSSMARQPIDCGSGGLRCLAPLLSLAAPD